MAKTKNLTRQLLLKLSEDQLETCNHKYKAYLDKLPENELITRSEFIRLCIESFDL